jgi:hypothetical protein
MYAFDIQQKAIDNTRLKITSHLSSQEQQQVTLFHSSHAYLQTIQLPTAPTLIVYNLGYLPGGDKSITTQTDSTLHSITQGLQLLKQQGALCITCYPGHEEGRKEESAILDYLINHPSAYTQLHHHRWIHREHAPSLIWITTA